MKLSDVLKVERRRLYGAVNKYAYEATLLGHTETAETSALAIARVLDVVQQTLAHADVLETAVSPDGTVWVLRYVRGWEYCMRGNGRPNYGSVCMLGASITRQQAVEAMMRHKAQYDADCEVKS